MEEDDAYYRPLPAHVYRSRRWVWGLLVLSLVAGEYAWFYSLSPKASANRAEVARRLGV